MDWNVLLQVAGFAVVVGGAATWLRSELVKQRHEELQELADTRGKRVEDLETKVSELARQVEHLKGQVEAIQAIKTQEIIDGVVLGLKEE